MLAFEAEPSTYFDAACGRELTESEEAALCYLYGDPPACDDGV